ncbi:MAG: bifunctional precorrin-2 dehydrogenase/sirohydrochlorin ferrochelatase [Desulfobacterales bacterium]|nr:MAG: bifunctional precorrin-2 dehydrogenase/sirohydrochlorin ferrochelatase [Desulfobacterales bacterium]
MRYYPIHLDIQDRNCLVVGGGGVGTRKVMALLNCGANVTVVSPNISEKLRDLAGSPSLKLKQRPYQSSDLDGMFLVIGATDDETLNRRISSDAERRSTLCNIADRPEVCNFILPSIVQRDDLVITISTSGRSPALAKKLRQSLETQFGEEYGVFLRLMGGIRKKLLSQSHEPEAHKPIFEQLINSDLTLLIKQGKTVEIDALLFNILGEGYKFDELINPP